jgi:hypothetical protein
MDPIIFEFLGGLLVGAVAGLMVVLRFKHPAPKMMPMLAVKKTRSVRLVRRRKASPLARDRATVTSGKTRRKGKSKTPKTPIALSAATSPAIATLSFETCPSCGLQAPGSLLAEHFMGSPSHRNGPPKIVTVDPGVAETVEKAKEEDSKQSVRNLLQMLVPPRAFGRRHAHRSMGPISSIVKDLRPPHTNYP